METSAAKRRKTSPLTAPPIDPARASYASPTKASLSRHNPDILLRRQSSPAKRQDAGQPPLEASSPHPDRQLTEDYEHAAGLYRRSDADRLRSPTRQLGGGLATRPRRTPVKPNPRPLPPPGPADDDDILNPFLGRSLHRSPLAGLSEFDPLEPELPPTPDHPDPALSTPPTGIHSTPSRRPRRSRALAERIGSSPTKQREERVLPSTETDPLPPYEHPRLIKKSDSQPPKIRSSLKPSDARGVESPDADVEKKRERDALLQEVVLLEADFELVSKQNERLHRSRLTKNEALPPETTAEFLNVLHRYVAPLQQDTRQSAGWVEAALNPIAFLPFGKPSSSLPALFAEDETSIVELENDPVTHNPLSLTAQETIPFLQAFTPLNFTSHITASPRTTGTTGDGNEAQTNGALLQHHFITVNSASAPGLFAARIEMSVDTTTHAITSLTVPAIHPSSAAAELAPLIEKVVAEREVSSSATSRNVSVLTWAMGSWLRVAVRRAKIWRTLDRELGTVDAVERTVARVRASGRRRRRVRRRGDEVDGEVDGRGGKDTGSDVVTDWIDNLVDTDDLLPYMRRPWMEFRVPLPTAPGDVDVGMTELVSLLRVQWRIEFDWTGEATSKIRADISLPGKWYTAGYGTSLLGIPALFDELVRRDGVVAAVETIVALLAGEQT